MCARVTAHQYSPATSASLMLKLTVASGESFVFEFTSKFADKERAEVREILQQVKEAQTLFRFLVV